MLIKMPHYTLNTDSMQGMSTQYKDGKTHVAVLMKSGDVLNLKGRDAIEFIMQYSVWRSSQIREGK